VSTANSSPQEAFNEDFDHVKQLNNTIDLTLGWTVDAQRGTIEFGIRGETNGWIAFALSEDGNMVPSDAYQCFVSYRGEAIVEDFHLTTRGHTCPGICNDVTLGGSNDALNVSGLSSKDYTECRFTRFLKTRDEHDFDIDGGDRYIIYAWDYVDQDFLQYHGPSNRGTTILNFMPESASDYEPQSDHVAHGVLLYFAVFFLMGPAVVFKRYCRCLNSKKGEKRSLQSTISLGLHVVLNLFASAIILIEVARGLGEHEGDLSNHAIIGTFAALCIVAQAVYGIFMKFLSGCFKAIFSHQRLAGITEVHRINGRCCGILGVVACVSGIYVLDNVTDNTWKATMATLGLYIFCSGMQEVASLYAVTSMVLAKFSKAGKSMTQSERTRRMNFTVFGSLSIFLVLYGCVGIWSLVELASVDPPRTKASFGLTPVKNIVLHENREDFLRNYYVQIEEIVWDYIPSGMDNSTGIPQELSHLGNLTATQTVYDEDKGTVFTTGRKVHKVIYEYYTDDTYTVKMPPDPHLGLMRNIIRAEVGDTIIMYSRNLETNSRGYSVHPHGVFYGKNGEGFNYTDLTGGDPGDILQPGESFPMVFPVPERSGPTKDEPDGIFWMYHSHIQEEKDVNEGLVSGMVVYKAGTSDSNRMPLNYDKEFFLLFDGYDENLVNPETMAKNHPTADFAAGDFPTKFNQFDTKFSINGYLYANLPGLKMEQGDRVLWHIGSFGDFFGAHMLVFEGETFTRTGGRYSSFYLSPASSESLPMVVRHPGVAQVSCYVNWHHMSGMNAVFEVTPKDDIVEPVPTLTREYFIQAEIILWDYVPDQNLKQTGNPEAKTAPGTEERDLAYRTTVDSCIIGGLEKCGGALDNYWYDTKFYKPVYREYTDATFTTPKARTDEWDHLGYVGPVIRARVGEEIVVHFKNGLTGDEYPDVNLFAFGGLSSKSDSRLKIEQGETHTYRWFVYEENGPAEDDSSSVAWQYLSTVRVADSSFGLIGAVIISRAEDSSVLSGIPLDVDRELVMVVGTTTELKSPLLRRSIAETFDPDRFTLGGQDLPYEVFIGIFGNLEEDNSLYGAGIQMSTQYVSINGFVYNSGGPFKFGMTAGEKVRIHLISIGDLPLDIGGIRFRGNSVTNRGQRMSGVFMMPMLCETVNMVPKKEGTFVMESLNDFLVVQGMKHEYTVYSSPNFNTPLDTPINGRKIVYYIAADEVMWNYAPLGVDPVHDDKSLFELGFPFPVTYIMANIWDPDATIVTLDGEYKKARYIEYTDETFTEVKPVPEKWAHAGLAGPTIRAQVGDAVEIVFKNNLSAQPGDASACNLYPYGIATDEIDPVPVGETVSYIYQIDESMGPGPSDPSSIVHSYKSSANDKHVHAGLYGNIIIYSPYPEGRDPDLPPPGVDKEFITNQMILYESMSFYFVENILMDIAKYDWKITETDGSVRDFTLGDYFAAFDPVTNPNFGILLISNAVHVINGFIFGNGHTDDRNLNPYTGKIIMEQNDIARFYINAEGNSAHSVHYHAQTLIVHKKRVDNTIDPPGYTATADMFADNPGIWYYHCHTNQHVTISGMYSLFEIVPKTLEGDVQPTTIGTVKVEGSVALDGDFTLSWEVESDGILFTMESALGGWLGFGFGESMTGSDIIYAENHGGSPQLYDAWSFRNAEPVVDSHSDVELISGSCGTSGCSVTFRRAFSTGDPQDLDIKQESMNSIIYAHGPEQEISYHGSTRRAAITIDFWDPTGSIITIGNYDHTKIFLYHGLGMTIAWGIMAPTALFAARFFKSNPSWLNFHKQTMKLVGFITIICAMAAFSLTGGEYNYTHSYVGTAMLFAVCMQIAVGVGHLWLRENVDLKSFDALPLVLKRFSGFFHRTTGRVLIPFGFFQIHLGLRLVWEKYDEGFHWVWIYIALWALAWFYLQFTVRSNWFGDYHGEAPLISVFSKTSQKAAVSKSTKLHSEPTSISKPSESEHFITTAEFNDKVKDGRKLVIVDNGVFDVADYLPMHPGGFYILSGVVGKDVTQQFKGVPLPETGDQHLHTYRARAMLDKMRLGTLKANKNKGEMDDLKIQGKANAVAVNAAIKKDEKKFAMKWRKQDSDFGYHICFAPSQKEKKTASIEDTARYGNYYVIRPKDSMVRRAYSALQSEKKDEVEFVYKLYPNGSVTPILNDLNKGDEMIFDGPYPGHVRKASIEGDVVIVAGGTGLLPFIVMINDFADNITKGKKIDFKAKSMTVLASFPTEKEILLKSNMEKLMKEVNSATTEAEGCDGAIQMDALGSDGQPRGPLKVHFFPQRPSESWTGPRGKFTVETLQKYVPSSTTQVYISGSEGLKGSVGMNLAKIGIPYSRHITLSSTIG